MRVRPSFEKGVGGFKRWILALLLKEGRWIQDVGVRTLFVGGLVDSECRAETLFQTKDAFLKTLPLLGNPGSPK